MIFFFSFSVSHCACGKKYGVPVEEKVNVLISREGDNNKCVLLVYCDNPTLKTGGLCIRHMKGEMDVY